MKSMTSTSRQSSSTCPPRGSSTRIPSTDEPISPPPSNSTSSPDFRTRRTSFEPIGSSVLMWPNRIPDWADEPISTSSPSQLMPIPKISIRRSRRSGSQPSRSASRRF